MDVRETHCEDVNWTELAQEKVQFNNTQYNFKWK